MLQKTNCNVVIIKQALPPSNFNPYKPKEKKEKAQKYLTKTAKKISTECDLHLVQ